MNIAYSTNENNARHMSISINSLLDNNIQCMEINFYIIDNDIKRETREVLLGLVEKYNSQKKIRSISFIDFKQYELMLENAIPCGSLSAYRRLFLDDIKGIERILYIDCDTVVCDEIESSYNVEMGNNIICGVQDNAGPNFSMGVGLKYDEKYINSGIYHIDLHKWRDENYTRKCLDFIKSYNGQVPCADQGTLNGVLNDLIQISPPKYNIMTPMFDFSGEKMYSFLELVGYYSNEQIKEAISSPIIIHYTGGFYVRPWYVNGDHQMQGIYRKYMDKSPWRGQYLGKKSIGSRTELVKIYYRILPFCCFISIHRLIEYLRNI